MALRMTLGFLVVAGVCGLAVPSIGVVVSIALYGSAFFVHELARAMVARRLGRSSTICVSGAGGDTELSGGRLRGAAALVFALAGSVANLFVAALSFWVLRRGVDPSATRVFQLVFLSQAAWGGAQLLPLAPFRVGELIAARGSTPLRFAHAAGSAVLVFGLGIRAIALGHGTLFGLVIFASAASLRALHGVYRELLDVRAGVDAECRRAHAALAEGHRAEARALVTRALETVLSNSRREALLKALAWSGIGEGDPVVAHRALCGLPAGALDLHLLAAYLGCCNRIDEAIALLEEARVLGKGSPESTKLLADLLFRRGDSGAVLALARREDPNLSAEDRRAIELAVAATESA